MPARRRARGRSRKPSRVRVERTPVVKRGAQKKVPHKSRPRVRGSRSRILTQRPARWWREPIEARKLAGLDSEEAHYLIAQERLLKTEQLKEQIRKLRQYSTEFGPAQGYTLSELELIRLPAAKLRKLKRAHESLQRALSQPSVEFTARTKKQKEAAKKRAGEIIPGQKRFVIHHGDAARAKAEWKGGEIQIKTTVKGGELYETIYYFPRKPRRWSDVIKYTEQIQRRGMRTGIYKIFNTLYGPIGMPVSQPRLVEALEDYFSTYSKWLAGTILGWVWMGTSVDKVVRKERKRLAAAERFKMVREHKAYKERRRIAERLGVAKRCRKCKRKRCICKAPEFR